MAEPPTDAFTGVPPGDDPRDPAVSPCPGDPHDGRELPGKAVAQASAPPRRGPAITEDERAERCLVRALVAGARVPRQDAEDVVQEVMLGAARSAHRFFVPEGATREEARSAWLGGIVMRCVAYHRRARARDGELDWQAEVPSGDWHGEGFAPSAEGLALARTKEVVLREGLALLGEAAPAVHAVVVAHHLGEMPVERVAALFGIPTNTAWDRLRRGREGLRGFCRRAGGTEG
jgi:DNA-directed RNA polymerase specialized sigma24 family protein